MENKNRSDLINDLESLLKFGILKVGTLKLPVEKGPRLCALFQLTAVIHNYAEAILTLLKEGKVEASSVLLRCIMEGLITTDYILFEKTGSRAVEFYIYYETEGIKFIERWQKFIEENPALAPRIQELSTSELCDKAIKEKKKNIDLIRNQFPYIKKCSFAEDIRARAREIDKNEGKPSSESIYLILYWYLSKLTHLTPMGLANFMKLREDDFGFKMVLEFTYGFYLMALDRLSQNFGVPSQQEVEQFKSIFEKHTQSIKYI